MHSYLQPLHEQLLSHANSTIATGQQAYMLNQFPFLGIPTPIRRKTTAAHCRIMPLLSAVDMPLLITEMWQMPEREYHYAAVEILAFHQKIWQPNIIDTIEFCLTTHSWWDSVDHIGSECLTDYFLLFPEQIAPITSRWNNSNNIWLQRSSILFQRAFKHKTDTELLEKYIRNLARSKEFFVQKAIGWALREYSKTNAEWVIQFIANNPLPPLSRREGLKWLERKNINK